MYRAEGLKKVLSFYQLFEPTITRQYQQYSIPECALVNINLGSFGGAGMWWGGGDANHGLREFYLMAAKNLNIFSNRLHPLRAITFLNQLGEATPENLFNNPRLHFETIETDFHITQIPNGRCPIIYDGEVQVYSNVSKIEFSFGPAINVIVPFSN